MTRGAGKWLHYYVSVISAACLSRTVLGGLRTLRGPSGTSRVVEQPDHDADVQGSSRSRSEAMRARSAAWPNRASAIAAISSSEKRSSQKLRSVLVGGRRRAGKRHKLQSVLSAPPRRMCRSVSSLRRPHPGQATVWRLIRRTVVAGRDRNYCRREVLRRDRDASDSRGAQRLRAVRDRATAALVRADREPSVSSAASPPCKAQAALCRWWRRSRRAPRQ
jgi:hypothetical protein